MSKVSSSWISATESQALSTGWKWQSLRTASMTKSYDFEIKKIRFNDSWTFSIWYDSINHDSYWKVLFKIWDTTEYEKQYNYATTSFSDDKTYTQDIPANTTLELDLQAYAAYSNQSASVSWTWYITYWRQLISMKKIRVFDIKSIWEVANWYLFWLLPNWEWRDWN